MAQDAMTPLVAILLMSNAAPGVVALSPNSLRATAVDAGVVLPAPVSNRTRYTRYYALTTIRSAEDLPFTTCPEFRLSRPRLVWLGLFVRTPSVPNTLTPGMRVVADARQLPRVMHGGCATVNVVADARSGATLGSWCNVENDPRAHGPPTPAPNYIPRGSPLVAR